MSFARSDLTKTINDESELTAVEVTARAGGPPTASAADRTIGLDGSRTSTVAGGQARPRRVRLVSGLM